LALAQQVQKRVEHAVNRHLPGLHGLALLLEEAHIHATPQITEFKNVLDIVAQKLTSTVNSKEPSSQSPNASLLVHANKQANPSKKRTSVSQLLPPSPECKQKRKSSHSVW